MTRRPVAVVRAADRRFAEHHPAGTRLVWPKPPIIRVGAHGLDVAPSAVGQITMVISGGVSVRFDLPGGGQSEPLSPAHAQPCKVQSS